MYAIITGASSDIGKAIARKLAENKYNLILTYFSNDITSFSNELLKKYKIKVTCVKCDIQKENDIIKLYEKTKNKNIKILINSAAICVDNDIEEKSKEEFLKVLEINLVGTFLVTKYILKSMKNGTVINISSLDSTKTFNSYSTDYIASKAGVNTLVKTMSLKYSNIKFLALLLPFVKTSSVLNMNPNLLEEEMKKYKQERLLNPTEIGDKIIEVLNSDVKSGSLIEMEVN